MIDEVIKKVNSLPTKMMACVTASKYVIPYYCKPFIYYIKLLFGKINFARFVGASLLRIFLDVNKFFPHICK